MTSAADHVVDGFADELEKLAFPAELEKLALFNLGKAAPAATGGLWNGIKSSPVGKLIGKPLKMLMSGPAFAAYGTFAGSRSLAPKALEARKMTTLGPK